MRATKTIATLALATTCILGATLASAPAQAAHGRTVFMASAVEHADGTVTVPAYPGRADGELFWYVVLDASTSAAADRFGANRADKLAKAGAGAVQPGHFEGGPTGRCSTRPRSPTPPACTTRSSRCSGQGEP